MPEVTLTHLIGYAFPLRGKREISSEQTMPHQVPPNKPKVKLRIYEVFNGQVYFGGAKLNQVTDEYERGQHPGFRGSGH